MNSDPKQDVAIFAEALQLPVSERPAFLERACGDARLRQRIEGLLRTLDTAGDFLNNPPPDAIESRPEISVGEKPGDQIGRYKLVRLLGEGGCGMVYLAEQEQPVRRQVALKVIRPGMDTKVVIARFEGERQALAMMDHPSIAKVFDAGATESGRPYFVMELVRGIKITDYCDQNSLRTEERLNLFVQVCRAVQHAHQKGIIHRDIKPSNILVAKSEDGSALPVVIDFGIAKATTNQPLSNATVLTTFEKLIGTPAYMSPEQADTGRVDVDTRTDIYSLGVLLYELLTGSTPFDTAALMKSGLDEIRRVIREREPERPSNRLSTLAAGDLTTTAQRRHASPPYLIKSVRGDLDWIVMKALEKDRSRRYETANGLARDVERHLANEAISARPPSTAYRFQKTVLRNKLLFSGIGLIAILLVLSLVLVSAAFRRERQAHRAAAASLASLGELMRRQPKNLEESEVADQTLRDSQAILSTALSVQRRLLGENDPASIDSLRSLGWVLDAQGKWPEAEIVLRDALAKYRQLMGDEAPQRLQTLESLIKVLLREKKFPQAEQLLNEVLTPAFVKKASSVGFLALRIDLNARLGKWDAAAADAELALALEPDNQERSHMLAPLLVIAHKQSAYDQLCQKMLATYADTSDPFIADRVSKDCLLLPAPGVDLQVIGRMIDTSVKEGQDGARYSEYHRLSVPYFQICKALSEYRLGRFAEAVKWAEKALQTAPVNAQAQAFPILAMAQWQVGDKQAAVASLAEADAAVARIFPGRNNEDGIWFAWIFASIWRDEAKALIEPGP